MYPSSNNYNHNPNIPISLSDQVFPHIPLFISENNPNPNPNPNSKFEELHLTSTPPFIHYEDFVNELTWQQLHDLIFIQQQQQPFTSDQSSTVADHHQIVNCNHMDMEHPKTAADDGGAVVVLKHDGSGAEKCGGGQMPDNVRRRSLKKDRHSKITTAKGPRDRRMRLSLDVARKFFDLQDILGFDKASKTVEWLLTQSSSAIKEITGGLPARMMQVKYTSHRRASAGQNTTSTVSSTSECEVISGVDDAATTIDNGQPQAASNISLLKNIKVKKQSCKKEKKAKLARRTALHILGRESRKVARERARKRTMEKRKLVGESKLCLEERKSHDLKQLGCLGHHYFEAVEESGGSHGSYTKIINPCTNNLEGGGHKEYGAVDILINTTGNWNPSSYIYTYHHQQQDAAEISHVNQNQFSEFEYCGKTWDQGYSNNMTSLGA